MDGLCGAIGLITVVIGDGNDERFAPTSSQLHGLLEFGHSVRKTRFRLVPLSGKAVIMSSSILKKTATIVAFLSAIGVALYFIVISRHVRFEFAKIAAERDALVRQLKNSEFHRAELSRLASESRQALATLEREAAELTVEARELRKRSADSGSAVSSHRQLAEITRRKLANVIVTPVINLAIGDGFAELFDLTTKERDSLNAAVKQVRSKIDSAVPAAPDVSISNGRVIVAVPPFEDAESTRQELLRVFETILGPERYATFEATMGRDSLDRTFNGFGSGWRQITISKVPDSSPERPQFQLSDGFRGPGGSSTVRTHRFDRTENLPDQYAWVVRHLPPLEHLPGPSGGVRLTPVPGR